MSTAAASGSDSGSPARLIVDASTLIRWSGSPVGIVRVETEIIRWILDHAPNAIISVYDTRSGLFRSLDPGVARQVLEGKAIVETSLLLDGRSIPHAAVGALLRRIEAVLRPILKFRRTLACVADEWRRACANARLRPWLNALVEWLSDRRLRSRAFRKDGTRRDLYRLSSVLGSKLHLHPRDTMISAGLDWNYKNVAGLAALKAQMPFRLVAMCYDLIPAVFPRYYAARDVEVFNRFFQTAILFTDRFISISKQTTTDLIDFARLHGRSNLDVRNVRLGADAATRGDVIELPSELAAGRYVLFVSTIEPRKNHAFLLRVWKRLASGEGGGSGGFKLVWAGRRGWMVDDVFEELSQNAALVRDVIHIAAPSDEVLRSLYSHAAFCVYPSLYEGFGLPVIEAFSHGKPVIASSAGSLPEAAGGLAPCLDPTDEDAWVEAIGRWLNDPVLVANAARRIQAEFSWPTWSEAAAQIVALAREP